MLPGTEWHVRHLIQVGLSGTRGPLSCSVACFTSPTSWPVVAVLGSISEAVQHLFRNAGLEMEKKWGQMPGGEVGSGIFSGRKRSCGICLQGRILDRGAVYSIPVK